MEGKNFVFERRSAFVRPHSADLLRLKMDVIVTVGSDFRDCEADEARFS